MGKEQRADPGYSGVDYIASIDMECIEIPQKTQR